MLKERHSLTLRAVGLTELKANLARMRPLLSTTGRRRCSLPFWNNTRVGSCLDHEDVSTRNLPRVTAS